MNSLFKNDIILVIVLLMIAFFLCLIFGKTVAYMQFHRLQATIADLKLLVKKTYRFKRVNKGLNYIVSRSFSTASANKPLIEPEPQINNKAARSFSSLFWLGFIIILNLGLAFFGYYMYNMIFELQSQNQNLVKTILSLQEELQKASNEDPLLENVETINKLDFMYSTLGWMSVIVMFYVCSAYFFPTVSPDPSLVKIIKDGDQVILKELERSTNVILNDIAHRDEVIKSSLEGIFRLGSKKVQTATEEIIKNVV